MLFHTGRYQEALEWARRASRSPNPRPVSFSIAVAALIILGRQEEAVVALADLLAQVPNSTLREIRIIAGSFFPTNSDTGRQFIGALREAGLPE